MFVIQRDYEPNMLLDLHYVNGNTALWCENAGDHEISFSFVKLLL